MLIREYLGIGKSEYLETQKSGNLEVRIFLNIKARLKSGNLKMWVNLKMWKPGNFVTQISGNLEF